MTFQTKDKFDIDEFIHQLPDDTRHIDVSSKGLTHIPDLSRFYNLQVFVCCDNWLRRLPNYAPSVKEVICHNNRLHEIPPFHKNLRVFSCSLNCLTSLPEFNEELEVFACSFNHLRSIPSFPPNLKEISCTDNLLTWLPTLPIKMKHAFFTNNRFTRLPTLPPNLQLCCFAQNPVYPVIGNDDIDCMRNRVQVLYDFRHLFYSLKYKRQFRSWLWERVREAKICRQYHPDRLRLLLDILEATNGGQQLLEEEE